jgi:hypothetical protein
MKTLPLSFEPSFEHPSFASVCLCGYVFLCMCGFSTKGFSATQRSSFFSTQRCIASYDIHSIRLPTSLLHFVRHCRIMQSQVSQPAHEQDGRKSPGSECRLIIHSHPIVLLNRQLPCQPPSHSPVPWSIERKSSQAGKF